MLFSLLLSSLAVAADAPTTATEQLPETEREDLPVFGAVQLIQPPSNLNLNNRPNNAGAAGLPSAAADLPSAAADLPSAAADLPSAAADLPSAAEWVSVLTEIATMTAAHKSQLEDLDNFAEDMRTNMKTLETKIESLGTRTNAADMQGFRARIRDLENNNAAFAETINSMNQEISRLNREINRLNQAIPIQSSTDNSSSRPINVGPIARPGGTEMRVSRDNPMTSVRSPSQAQVDRSSASLTTTPAQVLAQLKASTTQERSEMYVKPAKK